MTATEREAVALFIHHERLLAEASGMCRTAGVDRIADELDRLAEQATTYRRRIRDRAQRRQLSREPQGGGDVPPPAPPPAADPRDQEQLDRDRREVEQATRGRSAGSRAHAREEGP